jgi:hypothetical protein
VFVAAPAVLERGDEDALIQVRHRPGRAQRTKQAEDPGAPADFGGAHWASLDVRRQPCGVGRFELIE